MKIQENALVSIKYHLKGEDGNTIDQSAPDQPLVYLHGRGMLIPGLEAELLGKNTGDKLSVEIPPEQGYGVSNPEMIKEIHKDLFAADEEIKVGMHFNASGSEGQSQFIVVTKIEGDMVTVDGNHPLAGAKLFFDVEIEKVDKASPEQIANGHP